MERSPGHVPVSSVSWSPRANYIVSGSAADTNLIVWDVPLGVATRVRRTEGGGVHLVCVAPNGGRVFAASVGNVMRVWETEKWTCEKWTNSAGKCKVSSYFLISRGTFPITRGKSIFPPRLLAGVQMETFCFLHLMETTPYIILVSMEITLQV